MSPRAENQFVGERHRHPFLVQLPLLAGLVALWCVLWGHVDVISVGTGVVFSLIVVELFYLPAVELSGRVNAWWALRFCLGMLWHIATASLQIAWLALRPAPVPRSSIVAVHLRTRSDLILTLTAEANILVPGSVVVETDRLHAVIYLHVLNAPDERHVEAARREALALEEQIALAIGSRDDVWRINEARRERGLAPAAYGRRQRLHEERRTAQLRGVGLEEPGFSFPEFDAAAAAVASAPGVPAAVAPLLAEPAPAGRPDRAAGGADADADAASRAPEPAAAAAAAARPADEEDDRG